MNYKICTRCVMDTSDPVITFDEAGLCNHCQRYDVMAREIVARASRGERLGELDSIVARIKEAGKEREYDSIMGLSGGVDSSYVAYTAKRLGLRPLAVHFDSGWNSELAVNNIENIVKKLGIDLHTHVVDWEEMRDLQLAFFKASVANCDIPTDHAFPTILFREAARHGIKTILSGSNFATEFILPASWGYHSGDLRHILDIHRRFGRAPLRAYPAIGFFRQYVWYPHVRGIKTLKILNYLPYNKFDAKRTIIQELDWRDYGGKHYESVFTRFFQGYYLPVKFGYDKRRAHLASLINSGQLSREQAMVELEEPTYDPELQAQDKSFVAKKLGITEDELDEIFRRPNRDYSEYASNAKLFEWGLRLKHALVRL
ncbi:MAG: N-acetyl sugar amidotransferase [Candidatus Accumulibacter sp.]|uniref:N-acetyl sugar amidotransferase n=1 Tax=Accumulibacter sp. TaxID=2053492 RepID=UPI001A52542B|nr:N-acetyl sugar amidotransferase [Accumulibacter sp.]MBL8395867.1 N-acetyl sugar amidotransferase [Accumulibacter sp.]